MEDPYRSDATGVTLKGIPFGLGKGSSKRILLRKIRAGYSPKWHDTYLEAISPCFLGILGGTFREDTAPVGTSRSSPSKACQALVL